MKKFVFSLQKMRDYKKQILESEKNNLLGLRREKLAYEETMGKLENSLDTLSNDSNEEISKGTTALKLMFYSMQMDSVKREQTQVKYEINLMDMKIDKQRRKVVRFSQELSGLDKLEEQQREEYRKLEAKESETSIEEFLSFRMTSDS